MRCTILFLNVFFLLLQTSYAMDLPVEKMNADQDYSSDLAQKIYLFSDADFVVPCVLEKVLHGKITQIVEFVHDQDRERSLFLLAQALKRALHERGKTLCTIVNRSNATALHWAASVGHIAVVKLIFAVAGDNNEPLLMQQDKDGKTALHWAVRWGHTTVAKHLLIAAGNRKNRLLQDQKFIAFGGRNATIDLIEGLFAVVIIKQFNGY